MESTENPNGGCSAEDVGYAKLAHQIVKTPEAGIFRKFKLLHVLNALRLQAELVSLEHELQDVLQEDLDSDDPIRREYGTCFSRMREYVDDGDSTQYELLEDIRVKLVQYNEALSQLMTLGKATAPLDHDVDFLQKWLDRPEMGAGFLKGIESKTWKDANRDDFLTIQPPSAEVDGFQRFLNGTLTATYHAIIGRHSKEGKRDKYRKYQEEKIARIGRGIVAALSAILPTVVILALYFVKDMIHRIGLVIVFTTLFAVTLALFTGAKKVEIFSATAAFAAVEVVYIGSTSTA